MCSVQWARNYSFAQWTDDKRKKNETTCMKIFIIKNKDL